ncbi:unnamed protein product [Caenorhabditis angaria]|uniref:Uncharacterized protein n=1 Tax=Caenorhabditis angaria TaxID=860376 RepID=A0A9P1MVT5_9PELO|nr:unnamed protein product [Caenorhabditis angaria]
MTEVDLTENQINELLGDGSAGVSDELIDEDILNEEPKGEEVLIPQEEVLKEETTQEVVEVLTLDDDDCQIEAAQPSASISPPKRRKREATYMKTRNMARQVVSQSIASFDGKPNEVILRSICKYAQKILIDHQEVFDSFKKEIVDLKQEKEVMMRELRNEKMARLAMMKKLEEAKEEMERLKTMCGFLEKVEKPMIQPTNVQRMQHVNNLHYNSHRPMNYPLVNTVYAKVASNYNNHLNQNMRKRPCETYPEPRKNMRIEPEILMAPPPRSHQMSYVQPQNENENGQQMTQVGRVFGHDLKIAREHPHEPFLIFEQDSEKSKDVCLFIPHVPLECLTRTAEKSPPQYPTFFKNYASSEIAVTIRSSKKDFYDTWQLGGFVDYSKLTDYFDRNVQFYIQIHSMRPNGLSGVIPQIVQTIDWGTSKAVKCGANGKTKFRIKFHKNQDLPHGDRLSIFAVTHKTDNSRIDVSPIASLTFT